MGPLSSCLGTGCARPWRSRSATRCSVQGLPQSRFEVPSDRKRQKTRSVWNTGMPIGDDFNLLGTDALGQCRDLSFKSAASGTVFQFVCTDFVGRVEAGNHP